MHVNFVRFAYVLSQNSGKATSSSQQAKNAAGFEGDTQSPPELDLKVPSDSWTLDATKSHHIFHTRRSRVGAIERRNSCETQKETSWNHFSQPSRENSSCSGESWTPSAPESHLEKKRVWQTASAAVNEVNIETRRILGFMKWKLRGRRGKVGTVVKEIHITPELDETSWACKAASDTSSNSSKSSSTASCSKEREDTDPHTVYNSS